jgi:hypothetical protein
MMIAGIDYSTQAIDLVLVDVDDGAARLFHWDLCGATAFDRTRAVGLVMPARRAVFWDPVRAVGIEEPFGRGPNSWAIVPKLKAIQGAILACIPNNIEVTPLKPAEWRAAVGLPGNAAKGAVATWALGYAGVDWKWPQDAFDAYCIARAIDEGKVAA